ncbi:MAG: hypothetical protein QOJ26_169 [Thermoplasmata archaeon]|jgi:hypothetical protein|nr:hypothetical protein [Thermoplasmata archaeon]MEA3165325.1 hypothetical protein [Thermoplasmata archaeon]
MRLADRLFAYRVAPDLTDRVAVLLWLIGWSVPMGFAMQLGIVGAGAQSLFGVFGLPFEGLAPALHLGVLPTMLITVGWTLLASWIVSEAIRSWRIGGLAAKQWPVLIGAYLLVLGTLPLLSSAPLGPGDQFVLAVRCLRASFGLMLVIGPWLLSSPLARRGTPA